VNKIKVQLIPKTTKKQNVRTTYPAVWPYLRAKALAAADSKCDCCGAEEGLEVHEEWEWFPKMSPPVQRLMALRVLCRICHAATHIGTYLTNEFRPVELLEHLQTVNGWTEAEAEDACADAALMSAIHGLHDWTVDLSLVMKDVQEYDAFVEALDVSD